MINTQTQIDSLIDLAVIQRTELKQLIESLPQLRDHLSSEIERNLEEIEPAIRSELEQFVAARALDTQAKTSAELTAKLDAMARNLESTTAAKYSVLMAERAENANLLAKAEARIEDAASMLSHAVKEIVTDELSRFPRAGEIDQLRKEFAEPRGLNPRGRWQVGETYNKLDLVSYNGDSYVSSTDGNREKPSRSSEAWTLSAARGNGGAGGGVTSMTDLVPVPSNGELLIGNGSAFVNATLTAGTGISISNGPGSITINATDGNITLDDGTAAAPSLNFTNEPTTGLFRASSNVMGFAVAGTSRATMTATGMTVTGTITPSGSVHAAAGSVGNPSLAFNADQNTGLYNIGADNIGVAAGGAKVLDIATTGLTVTGALGATSLTAPAATNLTLTGGSTGASLVLGQGTTAGDLTLTPTGDVAGGGVVVKRRTVLGSTQIVTNYGASSATLNVGTGFSSFGSVSNNALSLITNNAEVARLTSTGNLLIGTTTDMSGVTGGLKIASTSGSVGSTSGALQVAGGAYFANYTIFGTGIGVFGAQPSAGVFGLTIGAMSGTNQYGITDQTGSHTVTAPATEVMGHRVYSTLALGASGTLTNWYGFNSTLNSKTGAAVLTNAYAFYANSPTQATNNYAFYSAGTAPSVFGGEVKIGASAAPTYGTAGKLYVYGGPARLNLNGADSTWNKAMTYTPTGDNFRHVHQYAWSNTGNSVATKWVKEINGTETDMMSLTDGNLAVNGTVTASNGNLTIGSAATDSVLTMRDSQAHSIPGLSFAAVSGTYGQLSIGAGDSEIGDIVMSNSSGSLTIGSPALGGAAAGSATFSKQINALGYVLNRTNNSGHYTGTSDNYGFTWTGTNGEMSTATGSMIFKPANTTALTLTSTAATFAGAINLSASGQANAKQIITNTDSASYSHFNLVSGVSQTATLYQFGSTYATAGRYIQGSAVLETGGAGGLNLATSAATPLRFYTNGDNLRMTIASAGDVSIASTSPSVGSTSGALQIPNGGIYAGAASVFAGDLNVAGILKLQPDTNNIDAGGWKRANFETNGPSNWYAGATTGASTPQHVFKNRSATTLMTLYGTGDAEVVGAIRAGGITSTFTRTNGDYNVQLINGSTPASGDGIGRFAFYAKDNTTTSIEQARILATTNGANTNNGRLVFSTSLAGTLGTALTLDENKAAAFAGAVTIAGTVIHTLSATPASASATGTVGTMSWDANYIYICTATNTWKRVAIATW